LKRKNILVGIDPGTKTGVAVLSLRGKVISVESMKDMGKDKVIKYISSLGFPTIIATDKSKPPSMVESVSNNFGSVLFHPEKDITKKDKASLTRKYNPKDSHQRDALAAAFYAFREYRDTIRKIEKTIDNLNLWRYEDDIKDLIIRKKARNISVAIEAVFSKKKRADRYLKEDRKLTRGEAEQILEKTRNLLKEKEKIIGILENYSSKLEKRLKEAEEKNLELTKKLEKIKKSKIPKKKDYEKVSLREKIKEKNNEIKKLLQNIKTLKEIKKTRSEGLVPVKVINNSTIDEITKAEKNIGIRNDILYFKRYSKFSKQFIRKLKENKVEMIIGNFPDKIKSEIEKNGIIVLRKDDIKIKISDSVGKLSKDDLKNLKRKEFLNWLKEYKKRFG